MEFIEDIKNNITSYYDDLVAVAPKLVLGVVLFLVLVFIGAQLSKLTQNRLKSRMDDPLLAKFIASVVKGVVGLLALLVFLKTVGLGAAAAGLLGTAGVGAFVIGFAFKDIGEHFLAGIIMAFNRPFRVGDVVELDGVKGKVVTLNLRNTHIKSFDGKDIYIPNGNIIKNPLVNYTIDGFMRYSLVVGLDYGSDIDKAAEIMLNTTREIDGVLLIDGRSPSVSVESLGTSTVNLEILYWLDTFDTSFPAVKVKTRLAKDVLDALENAGFYMPSDILEIKNYKDQAALVS